MVLDELKNAKEIMGSKIQKLGSLDDLDLLISGSDVLIVRGKRYPKVAEEYFVYMSHKREGTLTLLGTGHDSKKQVGRKVRMPMKTVMVENEVIYGVYERQDQEFFELNDENEQEFNILVETGLID